MTTQTDALKYSAALLYQGVYKFYLHLCKVRNTVLSDNVSKHFIVRRGCRKTGTKLKCS